MKFQNPINPVLGSQSGEKHVASHQDSLSAGHYLYFTDPVCSLTGVLTCFSSCMMHSKLEFRTQCLCKEYTFSEEKDKIFFKAELKY